jgi:hypothetical protein
MNTLELTENDRFDAWLRELDDICLEESGLSYRDLLNQNLKNWYQGAMSSKIACDQMLQNLDAPDIYFQEFDDFSDADPGL